MTHFRALAFALAILFLTGSALSQEIPTENPSEVWVKGRFVRHSWRRGRIWIDTVDAKAYLNVSSEYATVDLLKALEENGKFVWSVENGKFVAKQDPSKYTVGSTAGAHSRNQAAASDLARSQYEKANAQEAHLVYAVERFTADTGYVRAWIKVKNEGNIDSDPGKMLFQFQDGFGKTYSRDWFPLQGLAPGESTVIEAFSMTKVEDTSITPTSDNVAVNFYSDLDASKNPKNENEARKRARANKRSRL